MIDTQTTTPTSVLIVLELWKEILTFSQVPRAVTHRNILLLAKRADTSLSKTCFHTMINLYGIHFHLCERDVSAWNRIVATVEAFEYRHKSIADGLLKSFEIVRISAPVFVPDAIRSIQM